MAVREIAWRNFQGGLNIKDAPSELAENQFIDASNITIDDRGALWKRLGHLQRWTAFGSSNVAQNIFNWESRGNIVSQIGAGMHVNNGAAFLTWSTSDRCGMTEFNNNLMLVHPVDGFRIYDGTTVTGPFTNSPKGNTLVSWQNKVWSGGDPVNPARVTWCTAGTPATWGVNDWIEIRDVDSTKITNLTGGSGVDISGRPGLLVFKEGSSYRMHDSATGAYVTLDPSVGCASDLASVAAFGRIYVINDRGIFWTDGNRPMIEASTLVNPFFNATYLNTSRSDLMAAGRRGDRLYFSVPRASATVNGLELEFSPRGEWTVPHSVPATAYATQHGGAAMLKGSTTQNGIVLDTHVGGTDNGTAIASYFQTRWIEPNAGNKARIRRLRAIGKGQFSLNVYKDYQDVTSVASRPINIQTPGVLYDDGELYDDPDSLYAGIGFQAYDDLHSWGTAQAISVRIEESSSITQLQRPFLGSSVSPVTGAWNLTQINMRAIDLGEV
jgi:hypothetical protein